MPQAASNFGFSDDSDALAVLSGTKRFFLKRGMFVAHEGVIPTRREQEALLFLFGEWDYGYEGPWVDYVNAVAIV